MNKVVPDEDLEKAVRCLPQIISIIAFRIDLSILIFYLQGTYCIEFPVYLVQGLSYAA